MTVAHRRFLLIVCLYIFCQIHCYDYLNLTIAQLRKQFAINNDIFTHIADREASVYHIKVGTRFTHT